MGKSVVMLIPLSRDQYFELPDYGVTSLGAIVIAPTRNLQNLHDSFTDPNMCAFPEFGNMTLQVDLISIKLRRCDVSGLVTDLGKCDSKSYLKLHFSLRSSSNFPGLERKHGKTHVALLQFQSIHTPANYKPKAPWKQVPQTKGAYVHGLHAPRIFRNISQLLDNQRYTSNELDRLLEEIIMFCTLLPTPFTSHETRMKKLREKTRKKPLFPLPVPRSLTEPYQRRRKEYTTPLLTIRLTSRSSRYLPENQRESPLQWFPFSVIFLFFLLLFSL
ncbi:hypothetical protein VNO77_23228 [Canavalia gladiata]|uniref:Uncharacterized protein n=1 Tax=Canavalia gladiata TaxID=3824 RepID=A0AAN9L467_CANGL